MNAAKKIRKFVESGHDTDQVQVLKNLASSLELGQPFDLKSLYEINMNYFDVALELLADWRFDQHISSRSKLLEQLLVETAPLAQVSPSVVPVAESKAKTKSKTKT